MRNKLFPLIAVCLMSALLCSAQEVDESRSTARVNAGHLEIVLSITNPSRAVETPAHLQLIDTLGIVRGDVSQTLSLAAGTRKYRFAVPLDAHAQKEGDSLAWYRIKYKVGSTDSIVSLSEMLRDVFELRLAAPATIVPGTEYRLRVRAVNPLTKENVRHVAVTAQLDLDLVTDSSDDEVKLSASGLTDKDGMTTLSFSIPRGIRLDDEPEIEVTGRKNGVVRTIEEEIESVETDPGIFLTTDKPMYQPGETFNLRVLFLDANNTVIPGQEIELDIEDEDDTGVFHQTITTSEFGVASLTWNIPKSARLGTYRIEIDGDERFGFKISRYDLPNFAVTAEPDKKYYLTAEQTANVTVSADYLFGKPVTQGKVRVVRETDRKWNWKEQRYDIEEGSTVEGETVASGKYVARLDLTEEAKKLNESEWLRFEDLKYTAYFTDPTTNRTEQKRFDIRITKDPIHVYLIYYAEQNPRLPMIAYVSTFYADGTPASCSVDVSGKMSAPLLSVRTNSLGAAKLTFPIPEDSADDRQFNLKVTARDKNGRRGVFHENISLEKSDAIQLETDKAVYKPGDTIKVDLRTTIDRGIIYVDLVKDRTVLESRSVNVRGGRAVLQFLYSQKYKGALTIAAYTDTNRNYWDPQARFARGVIFPEQENFRLDGKFDGKTFRPGEDATLRFSVLGGTNAESALGVTIFDKAIEERSKTDGEFKAYFSGFDKLMGLDRGFGNTSLRDLNKLDPRSQISDEMQLAAEVILAGNSHRTNIYHSVFDAEDAHSAYAEFFATRIKLLGRLFRNRFEKDESYPKDSASLKQIVRDSGTDPANLQDPWGKEFIPAISVDRSHVVLSLSSSGPDKTADTDDDFVVLNSRFAYFAKMAEMIDRAVTDEYLVTGRHVRDVATLSELLSRKGVDFKTLTDPWKRPYQVSFETRGRYYVIRVSSTGRDRATGNEKTADDFDLAYIHTDYFAKTESEINDLLFREINTGKRSFPTDVTGFKKMLREGGIDVDALRDGYGAPVYVIAEVKKQYVTEPYVQNGRTTFRSVGVNDLVFSVRSAGSNTSRADDRELASFSKTITKQYATLGKSGSAGMRLIETDSAKGAIRGTLTDPNGAVIPGVEVTAVAEDDPTLVFLTVSDEEGKFFFANLPSGKYKVAVAPRNGFAAYTAENVIVRSQRLNEMDIILNPAHVSAMVDVTVAASEVDQTTNASISTTRRESAGKISFPYLDPTSTPRLREYFPETLLWRPDLITDRKGKAELTFKVADNMTTWKMYAVASTKNGKVAVVEKEFTSFQPFFVDLDPPKFLTEGDRISLPVQIRNYTEQKQPVDVSMAKADWFSLIGEQRHVMEVDAGGSKNAVFTFRADSAIAGGKQRVTASTKKDSDAIEKPVTVRPDGKEIVQPQSKLFTRTGSFSINFPGNALPGSQTAEVKIYPNLFAHVGESVEGLLKRPYGCGEQTISSTYPNAMILKFVNGETPLRRKAENYLRDGYDRLIGYQVADGGFTYWGGKDSSDIALTAYALRFLHDAKAFIDVDPEVVRRAEDYLARAQSADGSWPGQYDEQRRTLMTTAYVARSMAMRRTGEKNAALTKALDYLDAHRAEINDSHTLALFGLASLDSGDAARAKTIAEQLSKKRVVDGDVSYWNVDGATLFYGWGKTGRIETTALAVQLLTRTLGVDAAGTGVLYLLTNKDEHGVWYSTQTTINVLDALLAMHATRSGGDGNTIEVVLNGASIQTIAVEAASTVPVTIDLRGRLKPTDNLLEIRGAPTSPIMAQTISVHYVSWRDVPSDQTSGVRLDYKCDKVNAAIMTEINCTVEAGRNDSGRYGMLLAEIGIPPGADVNRESLQRAMQADAGVSRYEILPDRVVVYLWPRSGGSKFSFNFRPRYGIDAQTPPSMVYDYYNPDARATVAPLRFAIH